MNDRQKDVRVTFYEVLSYWLTELELHTLRAIEHHLILFLLNGVADDEQVISEKCKTLLEEHGLRMKEALVKLGEESEDVEMTDGT